MLRRALTASIVLLAPSVGCSSAEDSLGYNDPPPLFGAAYSGVYPNLLEQDLGLDPAEIQSRLVAAYDQLFHGDPFTEAVYYPVDDTAAFIHDVLNGDARTDGVGYAMMVSVQLDRQEEFDRVWTWAKTRMEFQTGPYAGLLAWNCTTSGTNCATTPEPNGTSYIATSLLFAEGRWGNGAGIYDYGAEARNLLSLMLHLEARNGGVVGDAHDSFDADTGLITFTPSGDSASFTVSAHHLPAFFDVWARAVPEDAVAWRRAAGASRGFLRAAAHPTTGLFPNQAEFDGSPRAGGAEFGADAYRVALNLALDQLWFAADPTQAAACDRLLGFFHGQGVDTYVASYTLDGTATATLRSTALRATNAAAALPATIPERVEFLEDLWSLDTPTGMARYYDGMLYLLTLLTLSGNYQVYLP